MLASAAHALSSSVETLPTPGVLGAVAAEGGAVAAEGGARTTGFAGAEAREGGAEAREGGAGLACR